MWNSIGIYSDLFEKLSVRKQIFKPTCLENKRFSKVNLNNTKGKGDY